MTYAWIYQMCLIGASGRRVVELTPYDEGAGSGTTRQAGIGHCRVRGALEAARGEMLRIGPR